MLDLDNLSHNHIMTLTQGDIAKVKVTVYAWQKFVSGPLSLTGTWMGMILHTIVVIDQGVVVAGGICPVRTCLVFNKLRSVWINFIHFSYSCK